MLLSLSRPGGGGMSIFISVKMGVVQKFCMMCGGNIKKFSSFQNIFCPSPSAVYIMNAAYTLHVLIKHLGNGAHRR